MLNRSFRGLAYNNAVASAALAQTLFFQGPMPSESQLKTLLLANGVVTNIQDLLTWVSTNGGLYVGNISIPDAGSLFVQDNSH
jgi:hypothetical protein